MVAAFYDFNVPEGVKLAVCGDIHEHSKHFERLLEIINPNEKMWLVSVGDIFDKGEGLQTAYEITRKLQFLSDKGCCFSVQGNHELKHLNRAKNEKRWDPILSWWEDQPLSRFFIFPNGQRLTIVHGGVTPHHEWDDLCLDVKVCYIRNVDEEGHDIPLRWIKNNGVRDKLVPSKIGGKSWHEVYDGRFGYIAAGHDPQRDGVPKFYPYSCNLDTGIFATKILTAQIFNNLGGLEKLIQISENDL